LLQNLTDRGECRPVGTQHVDDLAGTEIQIAGSPDQPTADLYDPCSSKDDIIDTSSARED
jgi:hypothetical protein